MKRRIEQIIVLDIEATCWENNIGRHQEIIQIGCVPFNLSSFKVNTNNITSIYVIPEKTEISNFCTRLTGINQSVIDNHGITFERAMKLLKLKYSKFCPWGGWGDFDRKILYSECELRGIQPPFSDTYYDFRNLYSLISGEAREMGLYRALQREGLDFIGDQHSAKYDALNTAILIAKKLREIKGVFYK